MFRPTSEEIDSFMAFWILDPEAMLIYIQAFAIWGKSDFIKCIGNQSP